MLFLSKHLWIPGVFILLLLFSLFYRLGQPLVPLNVQELQLVPDQLDNRYKYNVNSLSDLVTYKDRKGRYKQAFIYWASDRRLHIVQRDFPHGEFGKPVDIHAAIGDEKLELDSHNSSALGIASNGMMFVTGNHHVDPLNLGKTSIPYDITTFFYVESGLAAHRQATTTDPDAEPLVLPSDFNRVTYPSFFNLNGSLHFSYREQEAGKSAPRYRWMIVRYDAVTDRWIRSAQLNTGINLRLYVSNFAVDADNDSVHVFALWRDDKAGGGTDNQRDYFHLYSDDGVHWYNYQAGLVVSAEKKLWFDNSDTTLPGYTGRQLNADELIWDTPPDPIPVNAGAAVIDGLGYPHVLVQSRSADLYHHHWNGQQWVSGLLSGWQASSQDLIDCGAGIGALLVQQDRIVYRSLNPEAASFDTSVVLAEGFTNASYTLSVDQKAAALGYVSILLTKTSHHQPRTETLPYPQPAWVATYSCADLELAETFSRTENASNLPN